MNRLVRAFAIWLLFATPLLADTVRNGDILKMVAAGLSPTIIVEKISASDTDFDISTDALIQLNAEKVPEVVIRRMIQQTKEQARVTERVHETVAPRPVPAIQAVEPVRPTAPAPPAKPATRGGKRYPVGVHHTKYNRCPGEIRIDTIGIESFECKDANVKIEWAQVATICANYGARGELEVTLKNGKSQLFSTTTPIETKQLADRIAAVAPSSISVVRCEK